MGEERITFGPGTIYINGNEFAGISDFSVEPEEFYEATNQAIRFNMNESSVLSGTISLNMWQIYNAIGYIQWLKDNCPNKRVIYLIKHGKNERVRWKNFIRAGRIIARRLKDARILNYNMFVFSGIGGAVSFALIFMHLEKQQYYWSGAALMTLLINATVFIVNLLRLFKLI